MKIKLLLIALLSLSAVANADATNFNELQKKRIEACKSHFNILPYIEFALSDTEDYELSYKTAKTFEGYAETGELKLTETQKKDHVAIKCAAFSEGFITSSLYQKLVADLTEATSAVLGNSKTEEVKKTDNEVKKSIK